MNESRLNGLIGKRLYQRRQTLGLSQRQIAEALGISYQQVQKYENGSNRISAEFLYRICLVLKTDYSYFFKGASEVVDSAPEVIPTTEYEDLHSKLYQIDNPIIRKKVLNILSAFVDGEV